MTSEIQELKNCPFCGGVGAIQKYYPTEPDDFTYAATCVNKECFAQRPRCISYTGPQKAIDQWNTRAGLVSQPAGVGDARVALDWLYNHLNDTHKSDEDADKYNAMTAYNAVSVLISKSPPIAPEAGLLKAMHTYQEHRFGHDKVSDDLFQCVRDILKSAAGSGDVGL